MKITIISGAIKKKPKAGDRKTVKGVEFVRCYVMANIGTQWSPFYAYDRTGGRHRYEWVMIDDVNMDTLTRKRT